MELTIVYVTSRREPHLGWFMDSLDKQISGSDRICVIVVNSRNVNPISIEPIGITIHESQIRYLLVSPKPTIWQGKYRLTKEDWWAKSNALNTGICLCQTKWIAFVDDRSYLAVGWLDAIQRAMTGNYAVCGRYEKRSNVKVESGVITDMGTELGLDHRQDLPFPQPTDNWMGGHGALPLEWCLAVNGFSENICDSLGSEDSMFGLTLYNAGFPMKYDSKMLIVEDRTVGEIDGALKRTDKGVSPNDKSHAIVAKFAGVRTSMNSYDIRSLRESVLAGNPFPPPTASDRDWFDNQLISEME